MNSWKTTIIGIAAGLVGVALIAVPALTGKPIQWEAAAALFAVAGVGFFARDNNKSSEDVGLNPRASAAIDQLTEDYLKLRADQDRSPRTPDQSEHPHGNQ